MSRLATERIYRGAGHVEHHHASFGTPAQPQHLVLRTFLARMNLDLAASLRTSFRVLWLLPKRLRQSDQKKAHSLSADWLVKTGPKRRAMGLIHMMPAHAAFS